jgi:hypothetical protein
MFYGGRIMTRMARSLPMLAMGLFLVDLGGCSAQTPTQGMMPQLSGDVRLSPGPSHSSDPTSGLGVYRGAITQGDGPNGAHIIFLNFEGATLTQPSNGLDDSSQNRSWIAGGTVKYPAFDPSPYAPAFTRDSAINAISNMFKTLYADFNVQVVTTRPASGSYTMCMVGGTPELVGESQGVAGVAPLDCGNMNEADVVYAFASDLDPSTTGSASASMRAIAITAAQETAHSFGLGHTTNEMDVMYPQLLPGQTAFGGLTDIQPDGSGKCGNGKTQDSAGMLKMVIGASSGGPTMTGPTPMVQFVAPTKGSTVPLAFTILVSATETGGTISKVEITSGGQPVYTGSTPPFTAMVTAPQAGDYELTATAYDSNGTFQSATVTFTAQEGAPPQVIGCITKADCTGGMVCTGGQCVAPTPGSGMSCSADTPCPSGFSCQMDGTCAPSGSYQPKPGETGASCTDAGQCNNGLCASFNGAKFCTAACDPQVRTSCPGTLTCRASGSDFVCAPNANNGGSGCSTVPLSGPSAPMGGLAWLTLAGLAWLLRRRLA